MANLEKAKRKEKVEPEAGRLFEEAINSKPLSSTNAEALGALKNEIELIAKKKSLSVNELLTKAESSKIFDEDFLNAISIARKISRLKK